MKFRITYKKTFTNGILKGFTVDGGWTCPDYDHLVKDLHELRQKESTRAILGGVNGDEYFIHHVGHKIGDAQ